MHIVTPHKGTDLDGLASVMAANLLYPDVVTNGTLLFDRQVRNELQDASVVVPSLDAATGRVFGKINRPQHTLKIHTIIDGLIRFRKEYSGQIWLEVFIGDVLNI